MSRIRVSRESAGLTQAELAARAGVSRQLVGALEAGRHLPRVDAALALARALDVDVVQLFGEQSPPVDVVSGEAPTPGSSIRVGHVGDVAVSAPARNGPDGFDVADAVAGVGSVEVFADAAPGFVVAGCEPGLGVLERILREAGMGAVAATSSSTAAIVALTAGRAHAAVVHGPESQLPVVPGGLSVERYGLSSWRVGLAAPSEAVGRWWEDALAGKVPVAQRESGAGVQRAFERAATVDAVPGPRVSSHLEAAWLAVVTGTPAVTIEPAALAVGARFHAIETHRSELWCASEWARSRPVDAALDVVATTRFQHRLSSVGGYDLTGCGSRLP